MKNIMKKYIYINFILMISLFLFGCGHKEPHIVNCSSEKAPIQLELDGHKGKMVYELVDAYWTRNLKACDIDTLKLDPYSFVTINDDGNVQDLSYPNYFLDKTKGKLSNNCKMYVCKIKVTNIDAKYSVKDMYENPYIFRADNIFLNYIDKENNEISYKNPDYYSLRNTGDETWATYELHPGESITYELGFLLGNMIDTKNIVGGDSHIYLGNTGGSDDGTYYQIEWSER